MIEYISTLEALISETSNILVLACALYAIWMRRKFKGSIMLLLMIMGLTVISHEFVSQDIHNVLHDVTIAMIAISLVIIGCRSDRA